MQAIKVYNTLFLAFGLVLIVLLSVAAYLSKAISHKILLGILSFCAFFLVCLLYPFFDR